MNFPTSPALNDTYSLGSKTWKWNGVAWDLQSTGLTSAMVVSALGYTPYNATNPSGYITSSALSPYLTSATAASTYQPVDADLTAIAALTGSSGFLKTNGSGTWSVDTATYLTTATAASTYQTQSGMSSYLTTATASSTYLPLAGGTLTGNLAFSGTGLRITGDFSNATMLSRTLFQSSTANGNTQVGAIPNGTAVNSAFFTYNNSDPTNASTGILRINASEVALISGITGTGTYLPIVFLTNNLERGRITTTGNWLIGTTTDNATDKLQVSGSVSATSFTGTHYGSGANLTGLTSGQVTTALGFTPYNSTNPNGYITSSGNAATATTASNLSNFTASISSSSFAPDSPTTINTIGYAGQAGLPFSQTDGGLYTAGYSTAWYHQIFGDFRTGQVAVRGKNNGTWQSWRTVLDSSNYTSYPSTSLVTGNNYQVNSLGVGTAGSGTAGEIRATNNITAYYSSDIRFKENVRAIPNALATVNAIGGKLFDWKDDYIAEHGGEDGYFIQKDDFGVVAQDVLRVFPVAVRTRPDGSLAVDYEKLSALAFAAVCELTARVEALEAK